ncbi:MAG: hypothetical protein CVV37_06975 [Nitrospira bacterium HGW-Nitrospira-1]|nr:MAG: hypothetical protein CVV37_06975 [Nitrospira bacterium HGW-Nitrospira-1]
MMYEDVIRDFAIRTKRNLAIIEQLHKNGMEAYETTQLVNSCLGLLVFPQQRFIKRIPETPIEQLIQEGWPVPQVTGQFPQVANLNELIRYLRNAIAHFNIQFIGDSENQIRLLRVWNTRGGTKTWEAELSVADLKKISERFS